MEKYVRNMKEYVKNMKKYVKNMKESLPSYIVPGTWKNSDLFPSIYRLWDLEKFLARAEE